MPVVRGRRLRAVHLDHPAGYGNDPGSGILIYTAVPDAEGTRGGLVSQAEPERLVCLMRRVLHDRDALLVGSLCAERVPQPHADSLHGAASHVRLFVSETTCERGNRFLNRRFGVPIDKPELALFSDERLDKAVVDATSRLGATSATPT